MKKKFLALALAVLACFTMVACSDEGKELKDINLSKYMELGEYTNVEVSPLMYQLSEVRVQEQMQELFNSQVVDYGITDRAVAVGDIANIDFVGYIDGVEFEGGSGQYNLEIGSGDFIAGFEDGLIGVMPGEIVELNLTFPVDYGSSDLAGKDVVFQVKVNHIVPEMTDEVIAKFNNENYSNYQEMEEFVRGLVQAEVDMENKDRVIKAAMQKIISDTTFKEIPDFLIEQQKTIIETKLSANLEGTGVDVETYLTVLYGTTLEQTAEANVKERMVIQAIANEAGIEVTEEELDTALEEVAANYGVTSEEMLTMMGYDRADYREFLIGMEVYEYVYENAIVVEAE